MPERASVFAGLGAPYGAAPFFTSSTLRFFARPSSDELSATGLSCPQPGGAQALRLDPLRDERRHDRLGAVLRKGLVRFRRPRRCPCAPRRSVQTGFVFIICAIWSMMGFESGRIVALPVSKLM